MKKIIDFFKKRNVKVIFGLVVGTILYCIGVVWILDLGRYIEGGIVFYAGGVTGISQLLVTIIGKTTGKIISKTIFIFIFNIPLFIIGMKQVSKRFTILSFASVGLQIITIYLFEKLNDYGYNPLIAIYERTHDTLSLAILGGLITGLGCGITLKYGASSGGMDIVSQYMLIKKGASFAKFSLTVDIIIIIASAIVGSMEVAIYTVIRFIIHALVLDKVYTVYNYMMVTIISDKKDEIRDELIKKFNHGITIFTAEGGYSKREKYVLEVVVSKFETEAYRDVAKSIDPKVFITYTSIKKIDGSFNKNLIA